MARLDYRRPPNTNLDDLLAQAQARKNSIDTFLAIPTPTQGQVLAEVRLIDQTQKKIITVLEELIRRALNMKKMIWLLVVLGALCFGQAEAATPCIKHAFVSGVADSADPTEIRPSDWNACHTIDDGAIPISKLAVDIATQTELDNHINDTSSAHEATSIGVTNVKKTIWWGAGSLSTDGTQCGAPAEVTLGSGPKQWTIICTDNDAATIYGSVKMPDSWNGGAVEFKAIYVQTAANTAALVGHVAAQCRGPGEAVSNTWSAEQAISDTNVTGSNGTDQVAAASTLTPNGTCAGGDMLWFRYQVDATGTTTAMATLHFLGFGMEYGISSLSD